MTPRLISFAALAFAPIVTVAAQEREPVEVVVETRGEEARSVAGKVRAERVREVRALVDKASKSGGMEALDSEERSSLRRWVRGSVGDGATRAIREIAAPVRVRASSLNSRARPLAIVVDDEQDPQGKADKQKSKDKQKAKNKKKSKDKQKSKRKAVEKLDKLRLRYEKAKKAYMKAEKALKSDSDVDAFTFYTPGKVYYGTLQGGKVLDAKGHEVGRGEEAHEEDVELELRTTSKAPGGFRFRSGSEGDRKGRRVFEFREEAKPRGRWIIETTEDGNGDKALVRERARKDRFVRGLTVTGRAGDGARLRGLAESRAREVAEKAEAIRVRLMPDGEASSGESEEVEVYEVRGRVGEREGHEGHTYRASVEVHESHGEGHHEGHHEEDAELRALIGQMRAELRALREMVTAIRAEMRSGRAQPRPGRGATTTRRSSRAEGQRRRVSRSGRGRNDR
ncbi:MAG: hypothetical protein AB8H80_10970 [Planctomycetota bacterium]